MGFDIEKFFAHPMLDVVKCAICHDVLENPMRFDLCQHQVCFECLMGMLLAHRHACPCCRQKSIARTAPRFVMEVVDHLQMKCDFWDNGCRARITKHSMNTHLAECPYKPVPCSHCGRKYAQRRHVTHELFCPRNPNRSSLMDHCCDECQRYVRGHTTNDLGPN